MGDFNSYSPRWGYPDLEPKGKAKIRKTESPPVKWHGSTARRTTYLLLWSLGNNKQLPDKVVPKVEQCQATKGEKQRADNSATEAVDIRQMHESAHQRERDRSLN